MTRTVPRAAVAVVLGLTIGGGGFVLGASTRTAAGLAGAAPVAGGRGMLVVADRVDSTRIASWSAPYRLCAGHGPVADDEVAVDVPTALTRGIRLGQTVGVRGLEGGTFRVVGLVGQGSGEPLVLVSTSTARRLLGADAGR